MGEFLTLGDKQVKKDYGYVAKIENGRGEYGYGNIEYEIVLEDEGEISNANWNNIVGDIVVYDMKGVKTNITDWTQYIVFVFRATRDSGVTEIKVNYIENGVFSPQKKEEEKKEKEEVTEIVLKAEKVSGQDNKYSLFFSLPKGTYLQGFSFKIEDAIDNVIPNKLIKPDYPTYEKFDRRKVYNVGKTINENIFDVFSFTIEGDIKNLFTDVRITIVDKKQSDSPIKKNVDYVV